MGTASRNGLSLLAAEATRLAEEVRDLERKVADAVDVPACHPARQAALQLQELVDVLASVE